MKITFFFMLSSSCRERWDPSVQVPQMESQGQDHKGGGRGLQICGCWAKRASLLHTVYPYGYHWQPKARFHHISPLHPSQAQRSLCYQLVRILFNYREDGPVSTAFDLSVFYVGDQENRYAWAIVRPWLIATLAWTPLRLISTTWARQHFQD